MKKIFLLIMAAALMVACGPNHDKLMGEIEDYEDSVFESAIGADPAVADKLTEMYLNFADKFPTDTLAPIYLMKAAEVQSNVLHTEKAIELFDRVIANYPDFDEVPMCYFLKGNTYDLNSQYDEAKKAYQEFVEKYPNHFMAEQVRIMLPRIGMSPEEMLADILSNTNDTIIASDKR